MGISKRQIDKLGERLKKGFHTSSDLEVLDEYTASHKTAFEYIVFRIRDVMGLEPTGRRVKSTASIVAKLQRESVRLSQIQDIAGCRIVVEDIYWQNTMVDYLTEHLGYAGVAFSLTDRREKPSNGYRAVHIIATWMGRNVEIQLRTKLQHLWAEISEKLSDYDPEIKYGAGNHKTRTLLDKTSQLVEEVEMAAKKIFSSTRTREMAGNLTKEDRKEITDIHKMVENAHTLISDGFTRIIAEIM